MDIPIRIYYHVTMVNHYLEITEYILNKARDSGLLDVCDGFYIGALGDESELPKLQELILKYPKAQLRAHSTRKADYEFHTLRLIKKDADTLPLFYGVYVHSKSISYPKDGNESGKTHNDHLWDMWWMKLMCHYVVTEWRRWYRAFSLKGFGYDIAGCRIVPARKSASSRTHASGNFWAAQSDYLKTLSDDTIKISDWKDIFEGEMWAFSGSTVQHVSNTENENSRILYQFPIVYILSNVCMDGFPFEEDFDTWIKSATNLEDYMI